jgi:hypothetical protein
MTADQEARIERLQKLARILDTAIPVPVIGGVGVDGLLGLIPGVGDVATGAISLYLVLEALAAGAGPVLIVRMLINVLIDVVLGTVPGLGDLFDFAFKANTINVRLLVEAIERKQGLL